MQIDSVPPTKQQDTAPKTDFDQRVAEYGESLNGQYSLKPSGHLNPLKIMSPEDSKHTLLSLFANGEDDTDISLDKSTNKFIGIPENIDLNVELDEYGNTCLHYAAALGRLSLAKLLIDTVKTTSVFQLDTDTSPTVNLTDIQIHHPGSSILLNKQKETPLMRAVTQIHCFNANVFHEILALFLPCIGMRDDKDRTVFHHVVLASEKIGCSKSALFYLECLLENVSACTSSLVLNVQDWNGDTALNIAARLGKENMIKMLVDAGSNPHVKNLSGLNVFDFGFGEERGVGKEEKMCFSDNEPVPDLNIPQVIEKVKNEHGDDISKGSVLFALISSCPRQTYIHV
jgi:ankyrin repeat protein